MAKKEMPNAPRPTGAGLNAPIYWVRDRVTKDYEGHQRPLKIWGENLTYDQAWKLKETIAGQRKSSTARVEVMHAGDPSKQKVMPVVTHHGHVVATADVFSHVTPGSGWTETQRAAAAEDAARFAAASAVTATSPAVTEDEQALINTLMAEHANGVGDAELDALLDEDSTDTLGSER